MIKPFQKTRWEIQRHFVLRLFIAIISCMVLIQWYEWLTQYSNVIADLEYGRVISWPLGTPWENHINDIAYSYSKIILWSSIGLAILSILMTANTHTYIPAFFVSLISFLLMQTLFAFDYRLASPTHHVTTVFGLIFFFLPNKRKNLKTIGLLILVLTGFYHLNDEVLSGRAYGLEWIFNLHIPFIIGLLFLRISSPFLLYSEKRWARYLGAFIFTGTLSMEFLLLHQGPSLLLLFLILLFLYFDSQEKRKVDLLYQSYILPEPHPAWPVLLVFTYIGLQFSYLATPKVWPDTLRFFFTTHSRSKITHCSTAIATYAPNLSQLIRSEIGLSGSKSCDLVEVYQLVKDQCSNQLSGDKAKIQILHESKYLSGPFMDRTAKVKINELDYCEKFLDATFFEVTKWIQSEESKSKYF